MDLRMLKIKNKQTSNSQWLQQCCRGFPFVFREKPFGSPYICANFATVRTGEGNNAHPQEAANGFPTKQRERTNVDRNGAGPQEISIEL